MIRTQLRAPLSSPKSLSRDFLGEVLTAVACLVLLLASPMAAAGPTDEEEVQDREFSEEIFVEGSAGTAARASSVTSKFDVPLQQTPASVGVVTRALSREQNNGVLSDALRNVSGVNIQTQSGVHDYFVIRGFDSLSAGLVMTDGIAEPEATYYQLYNVERVEVLKGPGGFLYGGNSLAGTVNLIRRQPTRNTFASVGVGIGSFGHRRLRLDLNLRPSESRISLRLTGQFDESDGFRDDKASESLGINPVLRVDLSDSSSLHFNFEFLSNDYSPDSGLPVSGATSFDLPRGLSYQSPFDFSDQEVTRLRVSWEGVVGSSLTLRNTAYLTELDWLSEGTIFLGVFDIPFAGELLFRYLVPLDDEQVFYGNQFEGVLSTDKHQLVFGVEISEHRDEFSIDVGDLPPISVFQPFETATLPVPLIPFLSERGDSKSTVIAPYFLDRTTLSDSLQIFWGARLDLIDYEDDLRGLSTDSEEVSPMLGLVYSPNPRVSFYANAGQGFAPPSTRVSGDLKPEESRQVEIGAKGSLAGGRVQTGVSVYHLERENIAIFDANGVTAQIGSQRSQGIEVDVAGTLKNGFRYQIAAAFNDAELTEFNEVVFVPPTFFPLVLDRSGNDSPFAPDTLLNVWVAKTFDGGFGIAGGGRFVSSQFIHEDNVFEIGDSTTLDASLFYELERWRLSLHLSNLTDEEYFLRGFGANSIVPAAGRSAFVEVEIKH